MQSDMIFTANIGIHLLSSNYLFAYLKRFINLIILLPFLHNYVLKPGPIHIFNRSVCEVSLIQIRF